MYNVKTRNWNCKKIGKTLLNLTCKIGVETDNQYYNDNDGRYWLETTNGLLAWTVWLYFMGLRRLSGGWTYIVRQGHDLGAGYKHIY